MANYGYQYETSPRKYEPNFEHKDKKIIKPNKKKMPQNNKNVKPKVKIQKKRTLKIEIRILINALCIFGIIFAVIACQALVEQKFKEKENLLAEYNELYSKINSAQEVSEDLRSVAASYGMQVKTATLIDLEKTDYTELNQEKIEEESLIEKIIKLLKK